MAVLSVSHKEAARRLAAAGVPNADDDLRAKRARSGVEQARRPSDRRLWLGHTKTAVQPRSCLNGWRGTSRARPRTIQELLNSREYSLAILLWRWLVSMRQLVYISSVKPGLANTIDPGAILAVSRRNNARGNVSGLLFFNGKRFLQALEGDDAMVDATYARIQKDPRHYALVVLSMREIESREFGQWAMAYRAGDAVEGDDTLAQVARLVNGASPSVRATFESFADLRRAA